MPCTHCTKSHIVLFVLNWLLTPDSPSSLYWKDSGRCHSQPVELSRSWVTSFPAWKSQFFQSFSAWQSFCICDPFYCPILALTFLLEIIPWAGTFVPSLFTVSLRRWMAPPNRASLVTPGHWDPVCHPLIRYLYMQGPFTTASSCPGRLLRKRKAP